MSAPQERVTNVVQWTAAESESPPSPEAAASSLVQSAQWNPPENTAPSKPVPVQTSPETSAAFSSRRGERIVS